MTSQYGGDGSRVSCRAVSLLIWRINKQKSIRPQWAGIDNPSGRSHQGTQYDAKNYRFFWFVDIHTYFVTEMYMSATLAFKSAVETKRDKTSYMACLSASLFQENKEYI